MVIEIVRSYKYLGVHLNNKLDHIHAVYKKGRSRLHLLGRLWSFGVQGALLRTFFDRLIALRDQPLFFCPRCIISSLALPAYVLPLNLYFASVLGLGANRGSG